jgi:integrase
VLSKRIKLTNRVVKAATPRAARYTIWDSELRGFGLRVEPNGVKSYFVRYRAEGGGRRAPQRFIGLGKHGVTTPHAARDRAQSLLFSVNHGEDPAKDRAARRLEPTVGDLLDRYVAEHATFHNRPGMLLEVKRHVANNIKPALGRIRIGDLSRADIKSWHASFAGRPYEGNRALAAIRKALSLAFKDWELRTDNPAIGIKPFPEQRRERFFSDAELSRIGEAVAKLETEGIVATGAGRVIRLLALTGMRLGEVRGLRWDWLDIEQSCFRLPTAKAGARIVVLGAKTLAYLSALERIGPYVCPGIDTDRNIGKRQFYPIWRQVAAAAGLEDARPHDFRHTVGTFAAQTGANSFLVRDALGHKTMAMAGRYVSRHVDPQKALADQVDGRISAALEGKPPAEVVSLMSPTR